MWFPNRSDTNRAVQAQKQARSLKFQIWEEEEVYYPCSENKAPLFSPLQIVGFLMRRLRSSPIRSASLNQNKRQQGYLYLTNTLEVQMLAWILVLIVKQQFEREKRERGESLLFINKLWPRGYIHASHLSLASFLWDIGKQYSARCDAAECDVPSGAILFAKRNFIEK